MEESEVLRAGLLLTNKKARERPPPFEKEEVLPPSQPPPRRKFKRFFETVYLILQVLKLFLEIVSFAKNFL